MNAYELADELAECIIDGSTDLVCVAQGANMLRQQADRIAELEKQGKPVAWMSPDGKVSQTEGSLFYIPLFTTPQTKPLSDDDVEEFEWMLKKYFNYKPDEPAPNLNRIIRTIEARVRGDK